MSTKTSDLLLREAYNATQGILLYANMGNVHKGKRYGNYWSDTGLFDAPLGRTLEADVAQWKSRGITPVDQGNQTNLGGKVLPVILVQHRWFLGNAEEGKGMQEVFVIFKKPLDQIFLDYDDSDWDEMGIPGQHQGAADKVTAANEKKGKPTPLSLITRLDWIKSGHTLYGSYVMDIKPAEIQKIVIGTIDDDYRSAKRL